MPLPTICLTFDQHKEAATVAFSILLANGLPATYFVTPSTIGTAGGPLPHTLLAMKQSGIEIGLYSGFIRVNNVNHNMASLVAIDRVKVNNHLTGLKRTMENKGFPVTSLAPNQRAWNAGLANMMRGVFSHVRVASETRSAVGHWQQFPIPDLLYIKGGGTNSLSNGDTVQSLSAEVDDLIANGGMWSPVIHRVSNDGLQPNYTIDTNRFSGFCQKIRTEVLAGRLRCIRYSDL